MKKHRLIVASLAAGLLLTGCLPNRTLVDHSKEDIEVKRGRIQMPSQASLSRVRTLEQGRMTTIYCQMTGIGDTAADNKVLFPQRMQAAVGITNRQANRRFMDMLLGTRRFKVYDDSSTVLREKSDIVIDGMVTFAHQEIISADSIRKIRTTVQLSVQMKDVMTGENLFPGGLNVTGDYGMTQGEGTPLLPRDNVNDPAIQNKAAADYQRALEKAFAEVTRRVGEVLRPMGKVLSVDETSVSVHGGFIHGFQSNDELVIFRGEVGRVGGGDKFIRTRPVAVVRCDGTGDETSQCDIIHLDPKLNPQVGDYAILSDLSINQHPRKE